MRRTRLLLSLLTACALVSAACSSDRSGSGNDSGRDEGAGAATTTIPPAPADKARAGAIVLRQADVGPGFTPSAGAEEESDTPEADKAFKECSQGNPVLDHDSDERSAESVFEKNQQLTTITSDARLWTNEADFAAAMDILASDAFTTCLDGALKKLFAGTGGTQGATVGDVHTVRRSVGAAGTDQATGLTTTLDISTGRLRLNVFLDMTFLRTGRAGVFLMTVSARQPFPAAETQRLTGILSKRLAAVDSVR